MSKVYTFNPMNRQAAIEMAAKIGFDGNESTVHCGESHFRSYPCENWVVEYRGGAWAGRHYYRTELVGNAWKFTGMGE